MIAQRRFTQEDQTLFARLSGDWNPLHVDPIAARRLLFGATVVHGVHALLWALDAATALTQGARIRSLQCKMIAPLLVESDITLSLTHENGRLQIILACQGGGPALSILAETLEAPPVRGAIIEAYEFPQTMPDELPASTIKDCHGSLEPALDLDLARRLFPSLAGSMPPGHLAALLASTRLVGMHCPGLHSIFSALEMTFADQDGNAPLAWRVSKFSPLLSLVQMAVENEGLQGKLTAFLRPPPRPQPGLDDLAKTLSPRRYGERRALIIGGSRGLGELAAKMIALGGGDVRLTYRLGQGDAERVLSEIGGKAEGHAALPWDAATESAAALVERLEGWQPTHLYYFATPPIHAHGGSFFDMRRFTHFAQVYANGLYQLVSGLAGDAPLTVVAPSTVFIDELPEGSVDYAAAKAAAEVLMAAMAKKWRHVALHAPRLPRLETDQNGSILGNATGAGNIQAMVRLLEL
ncbi:MAG: hypothetical protein HQL43_00055 [Alphaproteobacteria bacterium]|nr:hypothetical protein [Alphaproteobacteria bacterium]